MTTVTIPDVTPSRRTTKTIIAAALLAAAAAVGALSVAAIVDDDPPAVTDQPVPAVEVPVGSPDAIERRSLAEQLDGDGAADTGSEVPGRFGSPDAAERWLATQ